jgi:hypothetical protein
VTRVSQKGIKKERKIKHEDNKHSNTKFQNSASENPNLDGKKMDWEENKVAHFSG